MPVCRFSGPALILSPAFFSLFRSFHIFLPFFLFLFLCLFNFFSSFLFFFPLISPVIRRLVTTPDVVAEQLMCDNRFINRVINRPI